MHFGDGDFGSRYHLLAENIDQWRASAGSVDSVDLRFARQVVVNPESKTVAANLKPSAPPVDVQPAVIRTPVHTAAHAPQHCSSTPDSMRRSILRRTRARGGACAPARGGGEETAVSEMEAWLHGRAHRPATAEEIEGAAAR